MDLAQQDADLSYPSSSSINCEESIEENYIDD